MQIVWCLLRISGSVTFLEISSKMLSILNQSLGIIVKYNGSCGYIYLCDCAPIPRVVRTSFWSQDSPFFFVLKKKNSSKISSCCRTATGRRELRWLVFTRTSPSTALDPSMKSAQTATGEPLSGMIAMTMMMVMMNQAAHKHPLSVW